LRGRGGLLGGREDGERRGQGQETKLLPYPTTKNGDGWRGAEATAAAGGHGGLGLRRISVEAEPCRLPQHQ